MLNVKEDETEEQEVTEEFPAEAGESCRDVETPRKKKKKSRKDSDSLRTNGSISDSFSTKKKDKETPEEVEEQQQQEEVILEKKKKKKSKKRKLDQDEMQENLVETPVDPLETKSKRKKTEVIEEQHEVVREVENPVETSQKKKKRKRCRKKQGAMAVVQSDDLPAGGDRDPGKEPEVTGRNTLISFDLSDQSSPVALFPSTRWRDSSALHEPKEKTLQEEAEQSEATKAPLSREAEQTDVSTQKEVSV